MKCRFRHIAVLLVIAVAVVFSGAFVLGMAQSRKAATTFAPGAFTILVAGLDEAAENTDVLALCRVDMANGALHIMQIPRDTYFVQDGKSGKINRLFHQNNTNSGRKSAADTMTASISAAFGIPVDGYVFFSSDALVLAVDLLGGVDVRIPKDMKLMSGGQSELLFPAGEHHLNGAQAMDFVRYRAGYVEGDLGRLDAQLLFLSALYDRVLEGLHLSEYLSLYQKLAPKLLTNLTKNDIMRVVGGFLTQKGQAKLCCMRLPGEACRLSNGGWYYAANRHGAVLLLQQYFAGGGDKSFDLHAQLTDPDNVTMTNIYENTGQRPPVYTKKELEENSPLYKSR